MIGLRPLILMEVYPLSEEVQPVRKVFILRLWQSSPERMGLRGEAVQVDSGDTAAIASGEDLLNFLQEQLYGDGETAVSAITTLH